MVTLIGGEASVLEHLREKIQREIVGQVFKSYWCMGTRDRDSFSREQFQLTSCSCQLGLDERYVRSVRDKSGMGQEDIQQ